jgi:hypothetical protein
LTFEKNLCLLKRVPIDVANGHKLWQISKKIKEKFGDDIELMVGNIANPDIENIVRLALIILE